MQGSYIMMYGIMSSLFYFIFVLEIKYG
jgi:hypothetical protein